MSPEHSNPAARVHFALSSALQGPQNEILRRTWARVFSVEPNDTGEILRLLAELIHQISAAKARILQVESANHQLYVKPLRQIEKAFAHINLDEALREFSKRLGGSTLEGLEYTSEFIRDKFPQGALSLKDREKLLKKVEEIAADVRAADLDVAIKAALLEHIEQLRRALIEFDLRGPEAVVGALDLNLGFVVRESARPTSSEEKRVFKEFVTGLQECYKTVSAALGLGKLSAGAFKEILKLTSGAG